MQEYQPDLNIDCSSVPGVHNLFAITGRIRLRFFLWITVASEFKIFLFLHCVCSASTHWSGLLPYIFLAVFLLSILIHKIQRVYIHARLPWHIF